jgi:hypothetical protein
MSKVRILMRRWTTTGAVALLAAPPGTSVLSKIGSPRKRMFQRLVKLRVGFLSALTFPSSALKDTDP